MECQYVARFDDDRIYPWGSEIEPMQIHDVFTSKHANVTIGASQMRGDIWWGTLKDVGSYSPDWDSKLGLADMVGNAWEWCNDFFASENEKKYFPGYNKDNILFINPLGPPSSPFNSRVIKGGGYSYEARYCVDRFSRNANLSTGFRIIKIGNDD